MVGQARYVLALMMPNGVQKDGTVSEQWRLQWGYPPFRVDRDRLTGHIFSYITIKKHRTAKIMAPYYRQLFMGNPMALIPLSVDDLEGFKSRSRKLKRLYMLHVGYWYLLAKMFGMSNTIKRRYKPLFTLQLKEDHEN